MCASAGKIAFFNWFDCNDCAQLKMPCAFGARFCNQHLTDGFFFNDVHIARVNELIQIVMYVWFPFRLISLSLRAFECSNNAKMKECRPIRMFCIRNDSNWCVFVARKKCNICRISTFYLSKQTICNLSIDFSAACCVCTAVQSIFFPKQVAAQVSKPLCVRNVLDDRIFSIEPPLLHITKCAPYWLLFAIHTFYIFVCHAFILIKRRNKQNFCFR